MNTTFGGANRGSCRARNMNMISGTLNLAVNGPAVPGGIRLVAP